MDVDASVSNILSTAVPLAEQFSAKLVGLGAADVPVPLVGTEDAAMAIEVWQQSRDHLALKRFKQMRVEFERLTDQYRKTEWREELVPSTTAIISAARSNDLVVMTSSSSVGLIDNYRHADPASVVLKCGRPVLLLKNRFERIDFHRVVVAWKDTREARRAVADAVPLLAKAHEVTIVSSVPYMDDAAQESIRDVKTLLDAHNIDAHTELLKYDDEGSTLLEFIDQSAPDLVVAGAYGHSRLREWVFGGVTRTLLGKHELSLLLSN